MKTSTTIRLDTIAKKALKELAAHIGVSVSDLVNMFGHAVEQGKMDAGVMHAPTSEPAAKYPQWYLDELDRRVAEMEKLRARGKLKTYSSAKELFDEILGR